MILPGLNFTVAREGITKLLPGWFGFRPINGNIVCQTVGDFIERPLDHIENLMLHHPGLIADRHNYVALG